MTTRVRIDDLFEETVAQRVATAARRAAIDLGVHADMSPSKSTLRDGGKTISLDWLEVAPDQRGRGVGKQFMRELCRLADEHAVTIELEVGTGGESTGMDAGDVAAWYRRLGFVWHNGYMAREPS